MDLSQSNYELSEPLIAHDTTAAAPTSKAQSTESYHGKASLLSTGMLFGPSPRGIVDSIPDPDKPCLLFSDWCPIGQCAYISLLEKEWENYAAKGETEAALFAVDRKKESVKLFTVVHVCEALAKHDDGGSRLLKKLTGVKGDNLAKSACNPVLVHDGNIIIESCSSEDSVGENGLLSLLLPGHIDEAIGKKNSLRPDNPIGLYNMNLVSDVQS